MEDRPPTKAFLRRLALVLGVAWLALSGCSSPEPPRGTPAPPQHRLLFVGVDGATWRVIGPLIEAGELPTFERLTREGAYMPDFETMESTRSPIVWTTVATGARPQQHGVTGFVARLPDGSRIPVTSRQRRARAIWELASRRGLEVGVIGWWASWPAEEVAGYVVTDHANPAFADLMADDGNYWTADREALAALERDYLPLDLTPVLARHWLSTDDMPWDEIESRGGFTPTQMERMRQAAWNERDAYSWVKSFYRVDHPLVRIAVDLARERPVDLQLVYLRGPDPVQHYGWDLYEPEAYAEPPADLERDRGLVEGVYRYVDSFLAELLATRRPGDWVIVASDHGAEASHLAQRPEEMTRPGEHSGNAKGVLFLHGAGVRPGLRLDRGDPYDLFPTMAWLLGLPVSEELPGRPLYEAFEEEFVAAKPLATVPTYGVRQPGPLLRSRSDEAMIESLRSLGYIE